MSMDEQKIIEASQKIYFFAQDIQEEYGLSTAEMLKVLKLVDEGF